MADLNSLGTYDTTAQTNNDLLEIGITQASQTASQQAGRESASSMKASSLDGTVLGTTPSKIFQNPMNLGPTSPAWKETPDYRVPTVNPAVSVQVEAVKNPLGINAPVAKYTQPGGTDKPPAPVAGQLSTERGSIGASHITRADGTVVST